MTLRLTRFALHAPHPARITRWARTSVGPIWPLTWVDFTMRTSGYEGGWPENRKVGGSTPPLATHHNQHPPRSLPLSDDHAASELWPLVTANPRESPVLIVESDGWTLARTKGSHRQFVHPGKPGVVTLAGKLSADLPVGTERSILKQAGL